MEEDEEASDVSDEGKVTTEFVSWLSEGIGDSFFVDFVDENKEELLFTFILLLLRFLDFILVVKK